MSEDAQVLQVRPLLVRYPDWDRRLTSHLFGRLRERFSYGGLDCVLFAANAVQAMTGTDLLGELRGKWHTKSQAMRMIASLGGLRAAVAGVMGPASEQVPKRGDLVLCELGLGPTLCLSWGIGVLGPGAEGLMTMRLPAQFETWSI
jgi:hypothetical protein